jgi:protoporphyrin/coproporphyrin ferrochelatase
MPSKIGVLLVNLGTPEATDFWSVRRYLKEFLSDRRVVETSQLIWWPVLNFIILSTRPRPSGKAYETVWDTKTNEGPLKSITRRQAEKLAARIAAGALGAAQEPKSSLIEVDWAMRYGKPSIAEAMARLAERGCERLLVVPLYPQYAAATTATVADSVFLVLARERFQPALRIAAPYYDTKAYIEALARSVHAFLAGLDFAPDVILVSFHGIPQEYADKGDPYPCHCETTFRLLRDALGRDEHTMRMTYQSRFGPAEWLKPYTDQTVKALAQQGVKKLVIVTPGFSADCLETLQEIALENRHYFLENGGESFAAVPCLNDSDAGMKVIEDIVARELGGWI